MDIAQIFKRITAVFMSFTSFFSLFGFLNSDKSYDLTGTLYSGTEYDINAAPVKQPHVSTIADFYVATNGSDTNDGKTVNTAFATLAKARDAVRTLKSEMKGPRDITVLVCGGTYHISETITFTPADSGFDGYNVVYRNYPGETPVVDAGKALTGWQAYKDGIYRTAYDGESFRVLSENGKVGTIARTPDKGTYFNVSEKQMKFTTHAEENFSFVYDETALFASLTGSKTLEAFAFPGGVGGEWNWFSGYYPVTSIDTASSTAFFTREAGTCGY
ncbi:MAG: hypothetical protein WCN92_11755, partial [Eubacteriales bacterium]